MAHHNHKRAMAHHNHKGVITSRNSNHKGAITHRGMGTHGTRSIWLRKWHGTRSIWLREWHVGTIGVEMGKDMDYGNSVKWDNHNPCKYPEYLEQYLDLTRVKK